MKLNYLLPIVLLAFSCSDSSSTENTSISGKWIATQITSSGNAVPDYLVSDFEIDFQNESSYTGNLEFLELPEKGTYKLINNNQLLINADTFDIKKVTKDSLVLFYESYSVPFDLVLVSSKE